MSEANGAGTVFERAAGDAPGLRERLVELNAAAEAADGVAPFNEEALLETTRRTAILAADPAEPGRPLGLALFRPLDAGPGGPPERIEAELAVDPAHRGRGHGRRLLAELLRQAPETVVWAHGRLPAAVALAREAGMRPGRVLLRLARPLGPEDDEAGEAPAGVRLAAFRPGVDEDAFLALNAEVFAEHPEQGALDRRGLAARMAEPWFRAEDLLLAFDEEDGRLLGYDWLKIDPGSGPGRQGEIYVVGVAAAAAGLGLGRALMRAGLARMRARGAERTTLYVEGDNERALRLYRSLGYQEEFADVQFSGRRS